MEKIMNKKKVLLLNAGHTEIPIIERLKSRNYFVITSGNREDMPGHKMADKYIKADYSDKEAILKIAEEEKIDGIISCAYDTAYTTAAYVAEKLGLGGHDSYEKACLLHQKDNFKSLCVKLNIPNPISTPFFEKEKALEYIKTADYPIMVKPVDQASGIGIMRADNEDEGKIAVENAFEKSKEKRIVIEPFIEGAQESFVAFVVDGRVMICTACDCYSPINPFLIQTETMPSKNFSILKEQLIGITEKLFSELDLVDGIITLQYIVKDGIPYVIEMMRRCLGNRFLYPVSYVTGLDWYDALVCSELAEDCHNMKIDEPIAKYAGHHAIMSTHNGIFEGIEIPDEIMEHVIEFDELFKSGDIINDYMKERMGYIYYKYEDMKEIEVAAKSFNERIKLKVK
ncbi:ATP-grasp domain-containing protein [Pseudobutyrivibrio sp. AR14]|uniref:ATP-grasp domain-containing protein n=1 Tax=Pseudobutyrivibrio sp. AR14 TaxID=1520804 RepID=UPI000B7CD493|nr:ATP-grasp domain-containing protein [Pseudobutyrivibrio sp. AR14]